MLTLADAQPLSSLARSLQALPLAVHALVALATIAGLVLWLVGRQVLRPVSTMLACAVGAVLGFILWPALAGPSAGSPYLGLAAGLAAGLVLGFALYRLTTAATLGAIMAAGLALVVSAGFSLAQGGPRLAAASSLATADEPVMPEPSQGSGGEEQPTVLPEGVPDQPPMVDPDLPEPPPPPKKQPPKPAIKQPTPAGTPTTPPKPAEKKPSAKSPTGSPRPTDPLNITPGVSPGAGAELSAAAGAAQNFYGALRGEIGSRWEQTPAGERLWVLVAAVIGAGGGLIIGLVVPNWAAATVTAFLGAAIFLPGVVWLANSMELPGRAFLNLSAMGWTVVWAAVAMVGLAIQTQGLIPVSEEPKPKKKKAKKAKKSE